MRVGVEMRFKPQRWIPKDSQEFEHPQGLGICYMYTLPNGSFCAVGYGGKRNKHDFHYSYRTREKAEAQIAEYFAGLTRTAEFKANIRTERKQRQPDPENPTLAETAQMVREALSVAFPKTKFSVRSESYSMGCSIQVHWTDGPTQQQVKPILDAFERCEFDAMQDMKTYKGPSIYKGRIVKFGADYVQPSRILSNELLRDAALRVAFECDLPLAFIDERGCIQNAEYLVPWVYGHYGETDVLAHSSHDQEYYSRLIYQVAHNTSCEETQPVELPVSEPKIVRELLATVDTGRVQ